jgi:hypothetical protein
MSIVVVIELESVDVVHTISANLPSVDANDNTWTLDNSDTWASKLTQGDYTVIVNLSGNSGNITDSSSTTTTIDIGKPAQPTFDFVDTGLLDSDGITNNGVITVNGLEVGTTWQYSISGDKTVVVIGVLTSTLIAVGCKPNVGSVVSMTIGEVFLLISETLPTASVCLTCQHLPLKIQVY